VYPVNTSAIRADIGLNLESDKQKLEDRAADVRTRIPQIFQNNTVSVVESSFISVGQSFGKFVLDRAYLTLIICCIGIALYVMFAFRTSIE
jgi:preprotein translocase subunit SecF